MIKKNKRVKIMKAVIAILLILSFNQVFSQTKDLYYSTDRKGIIFGLGCGAGLLSLSHDTETGENSTAFSYSIPNIKVGYMINNRLALYALLPGATYKYEDKDRGYEGILVNMQYWLKNRWWISGGAGMTFDAAAFYTVDDPKNADFFVGFPAMSLSTGYEIWQKGKFALDIQYRAFYGRSNITSGTRQGLANMIIFGLNWY